VERNISILKIVREGNEGNDAPDSGDSSWPLSQLEGRRHDDDHSRRPSGEEHLPTVKIVREGKEGGMTYLILKI
jgi:hypothetical protein